MPNKHAAIKDLRKNKKRSAKNARMKTHTKALMAQFKVLIKEGKKTEAKTLAPKLQQALAKAAKTGVFHANKARRKISFLYKSAAASSSSP
ncbi:MAG: 30S ribosomal protein S20 [Candidatus Uhrbacteria bacterium]|nr:30S ribosomal protein S20 [Candidatus Uhrbacteria bacterium]